MKKKVLKKLALLIAISLIVGICWFANALCGNPVSKFLAERAADAYLEEHFPDTDYYIKEVGFNFKDTNYYAHHRRDRILSVPMERVVYSARFIVRDPFYDQRIGPG